MITVTGISIPCAMKDTGKITSPWSLDGLTGKIVQVERSAWVGYSVLVVLDNPPEWLKNNLVHTYLFEEEIRADVAVVDEENRKRIYEAINDAKVFSEAS